MLPGSFFPGPSTFPGFDAGPVAKNNPYNVIVYNKNFVRTGWLNDPTSLRLVLTHNGIGSLELVVPMDHPKLAIVRDPAARVVVEYRGEVVFSGKRTPGSGTFPFGNYTANFADDFRELYNTLGWPAPTQPITNQGAATAYDKRTGNAETVAKGFIAANSTRLGKPITVAANGNRGATITVQSRMHTLADRLIVLVEQAGLGMTFRQSDTSIVMDVYEPQQFPIRLTLNSGIVRSGTFSESPFTVSRTIVGGQGQGTAREFRQRTDTALESAYNDKIETFVDARDTNVPAELDARGDEALAEGAPKAGFSVELSETDNFSYGTHFRVGDKVTINIGGADYTDVLRTVSMTWSKDDGSKVTPTIGDHSDDPAKTLVSFIRSVYRKVADLQRNY